MDITTTSTHDVVPWLRVKADFWRGLTSDPFVLNSILGYRIEFIERPPLALPSGGGALPRSRENMKALDEEVQSLHVKGAIETILNPTLGFYSHLFLVPKKRGGGQRPVINLKPLNAYVVKKSFHMTTLKEVSQAIRKDDWSITIDLKDAFLHIPVHRDYRRFLRFIWHGRTYQFCRLPFGLTSGHQNNLLLRRYSGVGFIPKGSRQAERYSVGSPGAGGTPSKPSKVSSDPIPNFPIPGVGLGHSGDESLPTSRQARSDLVSCEPHKNDPLGDPSRPDGSIWEIELQFNGGPAGPPPLTSLQLSLPKNSRDQCSLNTRVYLSDEAKDSLLWWGSPPRSGRSLLHPLPDRVLKTDASMSGWGSPDGTSFDSGGLEPQRTTETHQLSRADDSVSCPYSLERDNVPPSDLPPVGQHHSSGVPPQRGGYPVNFIVPTGCQYSPVCREVQHQSPIPLICQGE